MSLPEIPGYDVEAELGRGGMGVVYRARRHSTGATLALKMILCGRDATFAELARFRIEAEAMACLNHPNIIKIRDVGVFSGYPYFALEYAERGSLKQAACGRPQPARWCAELVRTLAEAVQHAHGRGMLHRDLKPANVLLMADDTPKISDFGLVKFAAPIEKVSEACCTMPAVSVLDRELARFANELGHQYQSLPDAAKADDDELTRLAWQECATRTGLPTDETRLKSVREFLDEAKRQAGARPALDDLTHAGAIMGSPNYMAPEQAAGDLGRLGPPTDVYALGGILYELLTGRPPFAARNFPELMAQVVAQPPRPPREVEPGVPAELEAVCLRCLEKKVERRYPRASALADELTRYLESTAAAGEASERVAPAGGKPTGAGPTRTRSWWPFGRR